LPKPSFDDITRLAFGLFFLRVLATPTLDVYAVSVLVLLTALLAGGKGLQIVSDRAQVTGVAEELKTLQGKVASLSVAVGLSGRKL
jgi:hypothetical protein